MTSREGLVLDKSKFLSECGVSSGAELTGINVPQSKLLTADYSGRVKLLDGDSPDREADRTVGDKTESAYCVVPAGDGQVLLGTSKTSVDLWDLRSNVLVRSFHGHTEEVRCILLLED